MMKKGILIIMIFCSLLILNSSSAIANTVKVYLQDLGEIEISSFQLFFYHPNDNFDYPLDMDWSTFASDFNFEWGNDQTKKNFWSMVSLIVTDENNDAIDYAKGIGAASNSFNPLLKLDEGLLVTMTSEKTTFGIDIQNPNNKIFDFTPPEGVDISNKLILTEMWDDGNQIVTISAVPIPATAILFLSGIFGMVGIRRFKGGQGES